MSRRGAAEDGGAPGPGTDRALQPPTTRCYRSSDSGHTSHTRGCTMAADPKAFLTVQEYLDLERRSETKYEYVDGTIVAMVGASPNHNRIQTNLMVNLYPSVDPRGCEVFGS